MPTAASGAKLLLPQLVLQRTSKALLPESRSPRCTVSEEVPSLSETPRHWNHRFADKSREFIETIGTPRDFQNEEEPKYCCSFGSKPSSELI